MAMTPQQQMDLCARTGVSAAYASVVGNLSSGGQVSKLPKGLDWVTFDTNYIPATGATTTRFFTSRQYFTGPLIGATKSKADFNLDTPGQFAAPNTFTSLGIRVTILPSVDDNTPITAADFLDLKRNSWLVYKAGQRDVFRLRPDQLSGLQFQAITSTNASIQNFQLGSAAAGDYYRFGEALVNKPNQSFQWEWNTTSDLSMSVAARVRISLYGILVGAAG